MSSNENQKSIGLNNMHAPEWLDDDGYPNAAAEQRIANWPWEKPTELFAFIRSLWKYADCGYWTQDGAKYAISTGGWSGNEDLIYGLQQNRTVWSFCWVSSRRGGHYEFEIPAQILKMEGAPDAA